MFGFPFYPAVAVLLLPRWSTTPAANIEGFLSKYRCFWQSQLSPTSLTFRWPGYPTFQTWWLCNSVTQFPPQLRDLHVSCRAFTPFNAEVQTFRCCWKDWCRPCSSWDFPRTSVHERDSQSRLLLLFAHCYLIRHPSDWSVACSLSAPITHRCFLIVFDAIYTGLASERTGRLFFCPIDCHDQPVFSPPSLPPAPAWQS